MDSNGECEYTEQIVEKYIDLLLKTAYTILRSTTDAEDAVQETFIKLITKKPLFNDCEHEKRWLLRVTVNISKNMLKSFSRKSVFLGANMASEQTEDGCDTLDAVMKLPERYRTVIFLYYYEDFSIKDIADVLHTPAATVGTHLSRARKMLRTILKENLDIRILKKNINQVLTKSNLMRSSTQKQ